MNPDVFREYDIRGVVDVDLTDEFLERFSRAMGVYWSRYGARKIALGMDARLSSPRFLEILKTGITASGIEVVDLGMIPTPVLYYSLHRMDLDGGIAVTGSHNPPDYNGFKIALGKHTIFGAEIQEIRRIMEKGDIITGMADSHSYDIIPEYVDDIISRVRCERSLKVIVDPGNGVGGAPALAVLHALGMNVSGICLEPDGNFPNHHPDPTTSDGISMLRHEVLSTGAALGIGFDGDADRIGVIDSRGVPVYGDMITTILAREILSRKRGAKIIGEVKCSKVFFEEVSKAGGIPIMGKVGHSLMKDRLLHEKAALAGEMSGHIFFSDRWYGFDDAIYTAARLLEVLSSHDDPQAVFDSLPKLVNTPEIRIDCPDRIKFQVIELFTQYAKDRYEECVDIDGVRFTHGDSWGLARPSNTQPVIVLRFEARSEEQLRVIEKDTRDTLQEIIDSLIT
ncbi:MAG: phosphomannomutase/phosphoglucomutase [Desulfomonilia bacterium]